MHTYMCVYIHIYIYIYTYYALYVFCSLLLAAVHEHGDEGALLCRLRYNIYIYIYVCMYNIIL